MNLKTTLVAAAVGAVLAIPITAGAIGVAASPDVETPCGVDAEWMQEHWNDPAHWEEMESYMQEHWDEMGSFMHDHWGESGPDGFSGDFEHGPGMMGGFGMHGSAGGAYGMWQGDRS